MFLEIFRMQIRTRLTLQFLLSGGIIMIIASSAIYFSTAGFRTNDFYNQIRNSAVSTANLLFNEYEVDAKRVLRIEKDNPFKLHNARLAILNFNYDTIYRSDENSEIKINRGIFNQVKSGSRVAYKQDSYQVIGTLYFTNYDRFVIFSAAVDTEGAAHLNELKIILVFVCCLSFLLFFIVGWFYSGRAIKPISDVVKKVEEISIASLNLRVFEGNGTDEIGRLAKTFNKMLERLEDSFATQKNFIANASHELRTPLTSINGQLEVLMMKDRSAGEYKVQVQSVLDDIKSLIDLSNRLLLLARTSAENPMSLNNRIRIDEILWLAREEIKKYNPDYQINISLDNSLTDSDQMVIIGDDYLLKVAILNLMENGCKYSDNQSVDVRLSHFKQWIKVIFEDRGIGISGVDLRKVFEPFYRGSNASLVSGYGIGLSLSRQIIKSHNGKIELSSMVGKGTRVVVLLPAIA